MPDDTTTVRWATRWDRQAVTQMLAALAQLHGTTTEQRTLERAFEFALRNPEQSRFCVAERQGRLVGICSLHRVYSTWNACYYGLIQDVYVVDDSRRSGVGTAMINFLRDQAMRRGYCRVDLEVRADNTSARAFYATLGFSDTAYVVYSVDLGGNATLAPDGPAGD